MRVSAGVVAALLVSCSTSVYSSPYSECGDLARPGATVVYSKAAKLLCVFEKGTPIFATPASHGRVEGPKAVEGDGKTPEGRYSLGPARKSRSFGHFLSISYPTPAQADAAKKLGLRPGGSVGVHGPQEWYALLGDWQALINHSDGCIVVSEVAMKRLRKLVGKPVTIEITP